jgi:hypothetical protein
MNWYIVCFVHPRSERNDIAVDFILGRELWLLLFVVVHDAD